MPYDDEFPSLKAFGLYAAEILGDGNCLFNALSDQLYGTQSYHAEIRSRVIEHMREHANYYKMFVEVYPGGGTRRNPKRKNAGSSSWSALAGPSPADIDRVFQDHLNRMARGGVWGDNMEIHAFASAFDINVKIYQFDLSYILAAPGGAERPYVHIAYHTWEHYSSIRNIDGPHDGLPAVKPQSVDIQEQQRLQAELSGKPHHIPAWQVEQLAIAYPTADVASLIRALEEARGSVDDAYEKLLAADEQKSISSQQSSSIEREPDSGDEAGHGPYKRQDRKPNRNSKTYFKSQTERRNKAIASNLEKMNPSLEDLVNVAPAPQSSYRSKHGSTSPSNSDSEDWPVPLVDGSTSSDSDYTPPPSQPNPTVNINLKIKLSYPKSEYSSSQPPPKLSKHQGQTRKPISARDRKDLKKTAQKQAAKERKQAASGMKHSKPDEGSITSSHPTVATTALKTLYI